MKPNLSAQEIVEPLISPVDSKPSCSNLQSPRCAAGSAMGMSVGAGSGAPHARVNRPAMVRIRVPESSLVALDHIVSLRNPAAVAAAVEAALTNQVVVPQ
jgi:hypothetical protein